MGKFSISIDGFGPGLSARTREVQERGERLEAARELEIRALTESDTPIPGAGGETFRQRAERVGVDRSALENAAKFMKLMGGDTPASDRHGAPAPMEVNGARFQSSDSWTDGHGRTHTEGYRPVGGGRFERVVVVEERVTQHSRLVTRQYGGR